MATYLLNYNPLKWEWKEIDTAIKQLNNDGSFIGRWGSGNRKNIEVEDRVFVIKIGAEPKGIIASGWVHNGWYVDDSWVEEKAEEGKLANYIDVDFDVILNPKISIFKYENLFEGKLGEMDWSNQSSGIIIQEDIALELEKVWNRYNKKVAKKLIRNELIPEEIVNPHTYFEGATAKISVNRFERNAEARQKCVEHYGIKCFVCKVKLQDAYGERAKDFIHVHHTIPMAQIGKNYKVDPIDDLKPLCPNCHAVLHRYKPALTIEKFIEMIKATGGIIAKS